jgi:OmpA-OmpF porin, OOP family
MRKVAAILLLLISTLYVTAQENLVRDPSFEDYRRCPTGIITDIQKFPLKYWNIPTKGTTDYFNTCYSKVSVGIPRNQSGSQFVRTGKGYVGIGNTKTWFEYLQSELKFSLKEDSSYYVEFYVSLADYSVYSINTIGAYFSSNEIKESSTSPLQVCPQVFCPDHIVDTVDWVKISGQFKATGNEKYLILGCFGDKKSLKKTGRKEYPKHKSAYYYIDDVCVKQVREGELCTCEEEQPLLAQDTVKTFTPGEAIILPDITFAVNKWELQENVKPLLDSLAAYLQQHKNYTISVSGHTDNTGTEQSNQTLSENRAKAVKEYLSSKGIKPERITVIGYGSSKPVADNDTEAGKAKNRRVEIVIVE